MTENKPDHEHPFAYTLTLDPTATARVLLALQAEVDRLRASCGEAYLQGVKVGRDAERAAVVEYLRAPGTCCSTDILADDIERGEHRRDGEKP